MMVHLVLGLGLVAQSAVAPLPNRGRSDTPPVRVWLPDTTLAVGDPAQVYVALRDTSHLVVLHVDASGRIRVLFPRNPTDADLVPGGATFAVAGAEDGFTFRVPAPGAGTVLAVRARTPFTFEGLTAGNRWDYEHALLLLPTAGNPFAALLDIAERIAGGEAFNYDVTGYRTPGALASHVPRDSVCFNCLAARHSGGGSATAEGDGIVNSAIAIDHSYAAAPGGTVVDCSDATLVDSFCGVQDNSTETTVTETASSESPSYVYPVYTPLFFHFHRFRRTGRPPTPPPPAIALNLRRVPGRSVPPPPRRPPRIVVQQPLAPSHPILIPAPDAPTAPAVPAGGMPARRIIVRRIAPAGASANPGPTATAGGWGSVAPRSGAAIAAPRVAVPSAAGTWAAGAQTAARAAPPPKAVSRGVAHQRD